VAKLTSAPAHSARLADHYAKQVVPLLMKQFGYRNRLSAPRLEKIVVNVGCGEAAHEAKVLEEALRDAALITGKRPLVTRAKKAISNFKIKEGDPVGCKVTLRKQRMYEFLDRLVLMVLPRIRDFRGLPLKGFDRGGNYSFGIGDLTIFPELRLDDVHYSLGMDITVVTTAKTPEESQVLLRAFAMPFEKSGTSPAAGGALSAAAEVAGAHA